MSSDTDTTDPKTETDVADETARKRLIDLAAAFYDQFASGDVPSMTIPTRTKSNIEYDDESGVWVYGDRESTRSANSVRGARKLLKAIYTIDFLAQQLGFGFVPAFREVIQLT